MIADGGIQGKTQSNNLLLPVVLFDTSKSYNYIIITSVYVYLQKAVIS